LFVDDHLATSNEQGEDAHLMVMIISNSQLMSEGGGEQGRQLASREIVVGVSCGVPGPASAGKDKICNFWIRGSDTGRVIHQG
jgi:hypothetical protein